MRAPSPSPSPVRQGRGKAVWKGREDMSRKGLMVLTILVALVLAVAACGLPSKPVSRVSNFDSVVLEQDLWVGDDAKVVDELEVGDDLTVTDDVVIGGLRRISAQTAISCTTGGYITPTGSYQQLECYVSTPVSLTNIAIGTAGDLLFLTNTCTQTIYITDTGTTMLNTGRTLGQYDALLLWCDGTNWLEVSYTDN